VPEQAARDVTEQVPAAPPEDEATTRLGADPPAAPTTAADTRIEVPPWLVAAVAALVAAAVLLRFEITLERLVAAAVAAVLVVLASIDLRERRLPNDIVLPAAGVAVVANTLLEPSVVWLLAALGTAVLLALPLALNPKAMGMGDVKLGLLLGGALGTAVLDALLIGFLTTVPVALVLLARHGSAARRATLPLGPFLAFGAIVVLLTQAPA